MAFRVEISPRAYSDLDTIAEHIQQHSSFDVAERWFNGAIAAIAALKKFPDRCPIAEESKDLEITVRLLLFGRRNRAYRIYYTVHHEGSSRGTVRVLHVRHWARRSVGPEQMRTFLKEASS
jgi:plasmid stabilization system protein ParE